MRFGVGLAAQANSKAVRGIVRSLKLLTDAEVTILSERRVFQPYGLQGGEDGQLGRNVLICDGEEQPVDGKATFSIKEGDIIQIETPGGGGYGMDS